MQDSEEIGVSIAAIISNPDDYDGRRVRIIGAAQLEFEGNIICLTKEHLKQAAYKNCLWLNIDEQQAKEIGFVNPNGKYVLIEGYFDKDDLGHMGVAAGAIGSIDRFNLWEDRWSRLHAEEPKEGGI